MASVRQKTIDIRQFIIDMVEHHPGDIAARAKAVFKVSRQAVNKHLQELCDSGVLLPSGRTSSRTYTLCTLAEFDETMPIAGLEEHVPWEASIRPLLGDVSKNVIDICAYGFTEMLNNAIDHSGSEAVTIQCRHTAESIRLSIKDRGVGIFKKIKQSIGLHDEREAVLELAKGKLTTDPQRHTGEGVFFTSRMVDLFSIWSGQLFFTHIRPDSDWLIEVDRDDMPGTLVSLVVSMKSKLEFKDVFDQYSSGEDLTFSKTHVPIRLAQYGTDNLLSRSQARRVLSRFNRFSEVFLDFNGVEFIGQAFADEIFRVFQTSNPGIKLVSTNANSIVAGMIRRAIDVKHERQKDLF